jgi:tetratricopeptide (TPR) repeat protein
MVLGTLAYVAPEQASGAVERLDERSDVFGLGAILCEVLTGKPPYLGKDALQLRRQAASADLADAHARLESCGADAELVELALACLAPTPADRPRNAQAVAEALTAYLDSVQERLRKSELAQAEARARAAGEAKRRRLALALTCTVLLALSLGGAAALWFQADRQARQAQLQVRQAELTREVNDLLQRATSLREKARTARTGGAALLAQAREWTQRALALVENGPADEALTEQVKRLKAELDEEEKDRILLTALDEAHLAQAETLSDNRFATERAVPMFREAFAAYEMPVGEGEPAAAAERIRQRQPAVQEAILAALDGWDALASDPGLGITEPHREWLRAVLAAAEPEADWARQVRAARAVKDVAKRRVALEQLASSVDVANVPARALARLAGSLGPARRVALLRRAQTQYPADFWVNHDLGMALLELTPPERDEALRFLTAAAALRPESPGCLLNLGKALRDTGKLDQAIACYERAIALSPKYAAAYTNLGHVLADKGKVDEAIARCRKATEIAPDFAEAHCNLGALLCDVKHDYDGAAACFRKAIALSPKYVLAHRNLGNALLGKGKVNEAIVSFQRAVALSPQDAAAHYNLGNALKARGKVDDAIACFRKAIELAPGHVEAHCNLGGLLCDVKRDYDGAAVYFRKAIVLRPRFAVAHANLGNALMGKGNLDEAIACYRQAVALDPTFFTAHFHLGLALRRKGKVDHAIECYQKAVELAPSFAEAHCNLGQALLMRGDFAAALAALQRGHELGSKRADWKYPTGPAVKECARLLEQEKRLLDVLAGKAPAGQMRDRLEWARLSGWTRRYAAAVRFWGEAFAADAKLADDLKAGHRSQAAMVAARAAAGQGRDAGGLDDAQKAALRKQALTWLKADLAARAKQPEGERVAALRQWQTDEALAAVRDERALRALPEAERATWADFWSEVRKHLPPVDR